MLLFIALFVVGIALAHWSLRRYPEVDKQRLFAAVVSGWFALSSLFRDQISPSWFYTSVVIFAVSSTFLLLVVLRRRAQ